MTNFFLFIGLIFLHASSFAQDQQQKKQISTMEFAGKYQYGTNAQKEEVGKIYIYAESDSTILFYLELSARPPSDHIGELYGRMVIKNGAGLFMSSMEDAEESCKFSIKFKKDKLIIETVDGQYNCGFGQAVYADGAFKRKSTKNADYYFDSAGKKGYFKDLKF